MRHLRVCFLGTQLKITTNVWAAFPVIMYYLGVRLDWGFLFYFWSLLVRYQYPTFYIKEELVKFCYLIFQNDLCSIIIMFFERLKYFIQGKPGPLWSLAVWQHSLFLLWFFGSFRFYILSQLWLFVFLEKCGFHLGFHV